jgi:GAF domain-containing protein
MKRSTFYNTSTFRYSLLGFLLGCLFPVVGMILYVWINRLMFGWPALIEIQRTQMLLWIIDTAPLFLGIALGVAGKREDSLIDIKVHLEQTIQERISELQSVNQELKGEVEGRQTDATQLKSAAEELQLISEVARVVSMEQDTDKLMPLVAKLLSERFGFYHVGIFLLDEARKYAVLKASNSVQGQNMLAHAHRLEVGQVGIVGNVAATGDLRIASEVGEDAVYFNNPNLPETRSEIALPLRVRNQIIGVIDAQSKEPNAFSQARANILVILADQIAIAIENSRLYSQTQRALAEAQAFSRQFSAQAWEKVTREQQIGYLRTAAGEKRLSDPIQWEEAQQAFKNGETVILPSDKKTNREAAMAIPLRVREQTIGVLDIRSTDPEKLWQKEEINIIQAIADRVGLALENARLFEETTGRANRERTISEITTHIRSSTDPEVMLQTALDELKQALGAGKVQIRPYNPTPAIHTSENQSALKRQKPSKPAEVS